MRGYVFRSLMAYAEERYGLLTVERMLQKSGLPRQGAYTAVGQYPIEELIALVDALTELTDTSSKEVLTECGRRTIGYVIDTQAGEGPRDLEDLLRSLEDLIHANYAKLYPGSIVPSLTFDLHVNGWAVLTYRSPRPLADLAEGLILGSIDYIGIQSEVLREDLPPYDGRAARFRVSLSER